MKNRGNTGDGIFLRHALHQLLGLLEECLVGGGVGSALLDEIIQQLGHLRVEPRVGELVADDGLADVVDDALGDRVPRQLALLVQLAGDGVVDAGLDDQLRERQRIEVAHVRRRVGLNVGVEQVAHVGLVGLDVQLLARVLFDGGAGVAVELHLLLQRCDLGIASNPPR